MRVWGTPPVAASSPVPGTFEHRSSVRSKRLVAAIGLGILGALGIGGAVYAALDKAVTISVDGRVQTIHTFGSTVADALREADISVGPRDVVAPAPSASISDGTRIAVRYARPLTLTIDGETRTHWVTARNVGQALEELGVRATGGTLSVSRSMGIARRGLDVELRTLKDITIKHDKTTTTLSAPVLTVRDALAAAGLRVDSDDRVRPPAPTQLEDGDTITITRIKVTTQSVTQRIPFKTIRRTDSSMYEDESRVERAGEPGTRARVLRVTYVDGRKAKVEVLSERVLAKPVDKIVVVGTKERPSSSGRVGGGVDDLNWAALAQCESGGNPRAVNPAGYYGLYQFSLPTWRSVGGTGNPIDASPEEQTYRAKLLYKRAGAGQWPVCGSRLFT